MFLRILYCLFVVGPVAGAFLFVVVAIAQAVCRQRMDHWKLHRAILVALYTVSYMLFCIHGPLEGDVPQLIPRGTVIGGTSVNARILILLPGVASLFYGCVLVSAALIGGWLRPRLAQQSE
jgi:hypothetical protein